MVVRFLLVFILTISSLCYAFSASASNLSLVYSGDLTPDTQKNARAMLGKMPTTLNERESFVFSAKTKTENGLKALGYYRAIVKTTVSKEKYKLDKNNPWELTIRVTLNEATLIDVVNIKVVGEAEQDDRFIQFLKTVVFVKGESIHHGNYEDFKSSITSLALERGYFESKFITSTIAINQDFKTADVTIVFDSGRRYKMGDISFSEFDINQEILDALIPYDKGDFYRSSSLQALQNELENTQYFGNIVVRPLLNSSGNASNNKIIGDDNNDENTEALTEPETESEPFTVPVDVSLSKAKSHRFNLGVGFATDTKTRLSVGWKTPLINRFGHRQETKISYSKVNPTGHFIYSIPLTHANDDILQFYTKLDENDYGDLTSRYFSFQVGRIYNEREIIRQPYIRYLNEDWNTDGIEDDAEYIIPGFTWTSTRRKGPVLDPSSGFRQIYTIEGAAESAYSETSFLRVNAKWNLVTTLSPGHRFVGRAEFGYVKVSEDNEFDLSPSLRFYAGGDQSIRGFAYQSIGPTIELQNTEDAGETIVIGGTNMLLASAEYQYYFTDTWRGALFFDAGSVNNEDEFDWVYSVGPGVHYLSPVGAIRLDFGYTISEDDPSWRFHFSLGAEF